MIEKLSYKLNNEMKKQTTFDPVKEYNIVKIIEKRVDIFQAFLFDFINKEKGKFILPDYDLKKKLKEFFEEKGIDYHFKGDTQETLNDICNNILKLSDYVYAYNTIEVIIASNQDLDFDNCEVEPQISSDGITIYSYDFIFGDSQYNKFVDITKKAKNDMLSIIDKIIENQESFKGEVISLIDENDNKLNAIINNYINK